MTAADFTALLPLEIVAFTAIVVLIAIAVRRSHVATMLLTIAGLAAAFASLWFAPTRGVTLLLVIDGYALFYLGLVLAASIAFTLLAYDYFARRYGAREELYVLMLIATLGACVLISSSHLLTLFLGLELLSVSLYGMIAYLRTEPLSVEAGLKYLVLAAVASAFLLFGIALLYAALGTMELPRLAAILSSGSDFDRLLALPGIALLITGLGFKLAVVPFHLWTPDVYEGAPAPVTAYIATVSKGAVFALLLRYFHDSKVLVIPSVFLVFSVIALASMLAGNLLALLQRNIKRMLAYSSIAHLGYILVAFEAGGNLGAEAVTFYLAAYFVTTLGAFGVVSVLSGPDRETVMIEEYRGLFWRRPLVAAIFTAMLLSLAGIPLTAGFIAKFYVVAAGASAAMWALVIVLVVTSGIGLYYYLRVILAMYARPEEVPAAEPRLHPAARLLLAALSVLLVWIGILPGALLRWVHGAITGLS